MIRVDLPFELGTRRLDGTIDHPVLDIGSSYSSLRQDVQDWLSEHCPECGLGFDGGYHIEFRSEADATLFRMRWL